MDLPDYKPTFPKWPKRSIAKSLAPGSLDDLGMDLLSKMLVYEPSKRISARAALEHPWFDDLDKTAL